MTPQWPFSGRSGELKEIVASVLRPAAGVIVAGPAGIGKTRLLDEAVAALPSRFVAAKARPTPTLHGMAFEALARLRPPRSTPRGPHNTPRWEAERIAQRAAALPAGGVLVLVVDDMQYLDPQSALTLHLLAGQPRIRVVATYNTDEPADEEVQALWREGTLERVDLPPLSGVPFRDLVCKALGGPVHARSLADLAAQTRGNLVLLEAVLETGRTDGTLVRKDGIWIWDAGHPGLTSSAADRLHRQFAKAGPVVAEVLDLVALAEPLDTAMLAALISHAAVEQAEASGLVVIERLGRRLEARLALPLYSVAIRDRMLLTRRQHLIARLATALEGSDGAREAENVLRLALWQLEGVDTPNPTVLARAAQSAFARYDFRSAVQLAEAAIAAGPDTATAVRVSLILASSERWERAADVAREAYDSQAPQVVRAAVAYAEAFSLSLGLGRLAEAEARLDLEETRLGGEDATAESEDAFDELTCARVAILGFAGHVRVAATLALDRLATRDARLSAGHRAYLRTAAAWTLGHVGRLTEASALARSVLGDRRCWQEERPELMPFLVTAIAGAETIAGRLAEADRELALWPEAAASGDWPAADGFVSLLHCWVLRLEGRFDKALGLARDIIARSADLRGPGLAELAHCLVMLGGRDAEALAALSESADLMKSSWDFYNYAYCFASIRYAAQNIGDDEAACLIVQYAEQADSRGAHGIAVHLWHELTRLGRTLPASAADAFTRVEGRFTDIATQHATALASGSNGDAATGLDSVATAWAQAGLWPFAAEAAAQASIILARAGRDQDAAAAAARAWSLAGRSGVVTLTPALRQAHAPKLTAREREVGLLGARGLTDPQIAERLGIATRTVESHMSRVFAKVGIRDRRRLGAVFGIGGSLGVRPGEETPPGVGFDVR